MFCASGIFCFPSGKNCSPLSQIHIQHILVFRKQITIFAKQSYITANKRGVKCSECLRIYLFLPQAHDYGADSMSSLRKSICFRPCNPLPALRYAREPGRFPHFFHSPRHTSAAAPPSTTKFTPLCAHCSRHSFWRSDHCGDALPKSRKPHNNIEHRE